MDLYKYKYNYFCYIEIIIFGKKTIIKRQLRIYLNVTPPDIVNILLRAYVLLFLNLHKTIKTNQKKTKM